MGVVQLWGSRKFLETELSCPMSQLPLGNLTQSRGEPERVPGIGTGGCGCMRLANHNHPHTQERMTCDRVWSCPVGNPTFLGAHAPDSM